MEFPAIERAERVFWQRHQNKLDEQKNNASSELESLFHQIQVDLVTDLQMYNDHVASSWQQLEQEYSMFVAKHLEPTSFASENNRTQVSFLHRSFYCTPTTRSDRVKVEVAATPIPLSDMQ